MKGLADLGDAAFLQFVWKKHLRKRLQAVRLRDFELCHDPLEYTALDWELGPTTNDLAAAIRSGRYRAIGNNVVRAAKSVGLTRPISSPAARDLLIYLSLIRLVENELIGRSFEWTRFGRAQKTDDSEATRAESGWFRQWLKRQGQIDVITAGHDWIVESDVANFFGSISIDAVAQHVLKHGDADQDLVGLLQHMLSAFAPMPRYQRSRVGGLPQEGHDGSRVIAHTLLHPLDQEFEPEGLKKLYSRWVDDIVIGADTWPDALQLVRRMQRAMEALELYPNTSKTRIIPAKQFQIDYMKDENDYIGEVEAEIKKLGRPHRPEQFRRAIQAHARGTVRPKAWERVLRRYYNVAREVGEESLLPWWDRHLREVPGSAPQIFEYVATFRFTGAKLKSLTTSLASFGGTYEDIDILAREFVLIAANDNNFSLRRSIADWGLQGVETNVESQPFLAASCALVVAKFGFEDHITALEELFWRLMCADSPCRQQVAIILLALERVSTEDLNGLLHDSSPPASQHIRLLQAVISGDSAAWNIVRAIAHPIGRTMPNRWVIRPRALVLVPLLARSDPKRFEKAQKSWTTLLKSNQPRLRDAAAVRWLSGDPI